MKFAEITSLGFSTVGRQWVFNAYVIAFGGLLLVGGRLADLLGPRRIFTAGFAVLAGSSLQAGLAWTIGGGAKASAINVRSKVTGL